MAGSISDDNPSVLIGSLHQNVPHVNQHKLFLSQPFYKLGHMIKFEPQLREMLIDTVESRAQKIMYLVWEYINHHVNVIGVARASKQM